MFDVDEIDETLEQRCQAMDIHPAGVLAGAGSAFGPDPWREALARARVEVGFRSLRLAVAGIECTVDEDAVTVSFELGRGAFATAVLREICTT